MNYAGDDISDQAHQVMKNLRAVLEAAGMNFDHVARRIFSNLWMTLMQLMQSMVPT